MLICHAVGCMPSYIKSPGSSRDHNQHNLSGQEDIGSTVVRDTSPRFVRHIYITNKDCCKIVHKMLIIHIFIRTFCKNKPLTLKTSPRKFLSCDQKVLKRLKNTF